MDEELSIRIQFNSNFDFDFFVEEIKNWLSSNFFVKSKIYCGSSKTACLTIGCHEKALKIEKLKEWLLEVEKWLPSDSTLIEGTFDLSNGSVSYSKQKNMTFSSMTGMIPSEISFKSRP
jgi:hypothetical protein